MSEFCSEQNSRTVKRIVIGPFSLSPLENGKLDASWALLLESGNGPRRIVIGPFGLPLLKRANVTQINVYEACSKHSDLRLDSVKK